MVKGYVLKAERIPFETVIGVVPLKIIPPRGFIYRKNSYLCICVYYYEALC